MTKKKYKVNFEKDSHIPTCFVHLVSDDYGKPVDFVFDAVNDAFMSLFKVEKENILNKRYIECMKDIDLQWIVDVAEVVKTKTGLNKNSYLSEADRFIKVIYSPGSKKGTCSISFIDVTDELKQLRDLKEKEKGYRVMQNIAGNICHQSDYDVAINNALSLIQKLFSCDRVFTDRFVDGKVEEVHIAKNPSVYVIDVPKHTMTFDEFKQLKKKYNNNDSYLYLDTDMMIKGENKIHQDRFREFGSRNFLGVPVTINGKLVGFLGMTNFHKDKLNNILEILKPTAILIGTRMKWHILEADLKKRQ